MHLYTNKLLVITYNYLNITSSNEVCNPQLSLRMIRLVITVIVIFKFIKIKNSKLKKGY